MATELEEPAAEIAARIIGAVGWDRGKHTS